VTAGDACTVAVVVTVGVTAGAAGTAGGNFNFVTWRSLSAVSDNVRFGSKSRHRVDYSITSSAATSRPGGTVRPRALAVFMLMTVSYLVGA
jgi:hypothetical protein